MSNPEFFLTYGYGEKALDLLYYPQAVRVDNRVEIFEQSG